MRDVDGIRDFYEASNMQKNNELAQQTAQQTAQISSKMVEVCIYLKLIN
jgi:hypothetical protein